MSDELRPEVMTPEEVARYLRRKVTTIYAALRDGELPGLKLKRRWRVRRCDIDALFVGAKSSPPPPPPPEYPPLPMSLPPRRPPGRPRKKPPPLSANDDEMAKWARGYVNRLAKRRAKHDRGA